MKAVKTIIKTTFVLWLIELVLLGIVFIAWFIRFIVQLFVGSGLPPPISSLFALLGRVMMGFTYPIRFVLPHGHLNVFKMILLWGLNSVIWGVAVGLIIYAIRKRRVS